jgi:hypothetical protein
MELNEKRSLLLYADDLNLLGENLNIKWGKKNLLVSGKLCSSMNRKH